jgi:hypothetical protein
MTLYQMKAYENNAIQQAVVQTQTARAQTDELWARIRSRRQQTHFFSNIVRSISGESWGSTVSSYFGSSSSGGGSRNSDGFSAETSAEAAAAQGVSEVPQHEFSAPEGKWVRLSPPLEMEEIHYFQQEEAGFNRHMEQLSRMLDHYFSEGEVAKRQAVEKLRHQAEAASTLQRALHGSFRRCWEGSRRKIRQLVKSASSRS